jgi:K(+)-stimulated pyrophosphate-energized sodium pump
MDFFAEGPDQLLHILIAATGVTSLLAIVVSVIMQGRIMAKSPGTPEMVKIAAAIKKGAMAFLRTEYSVLLIFVAAMGAALLYFIDWPTVSTDPKDTFDFGRALTGGGSALCFVLGAAFSVFAGYIGMRTATVANVRTTEAAKTSLGDALRIAFSSGTVMGLMVVGLGTIGIIGLLIWRDADPRLIFGFSMGASSIALFARVGGGIYTKAADVGADLVGKVEAGIPEDDPRNPAVIADNVGDNVGDVAGMGADLYESYVGSIIAAMALGFLPAVLAASEAGGAELNGKATMFFPLAIAGAGIIASLIGTIFVKTNDESKLQAALFRGLFSASALIIVFAAIITYALGLHKVNLAGHEGGFAGFEIGGEMQHWGIFFALISGLVLGVLIGKVTEHYTSERKGHAQGIAKQGETGAATNIIYGLATGMQSTAIPLILIGAAVYFAYYFAGIYGIGVSAVGMLSTLGISLGIDAYGPVADNAGGIAEMAGCPPEVRERTDALDAAGNTTAAIGKGFAIGSAALTALALFTTFALTYEAAAIAVDGTYEGFSIDILNPDVTVGLLIGAMLPFLFSALTMKAVGRAAFKMIEEVRKQFREIPGIMEGTGEPNHGRCVAIATRGALSQMILPGLIAVLAPLIVGLLISTEALGGLLAGALSSGVVMAIFMSNAGGAWDNAKKYVEAGNLGGKGSDIHKAAVVGDTVGDPFKDTSGPSINILIKLMCIVSLIFIPAFINRWFG